MPEAHDNSSYDDVTSPRRDSPLPWFGIEENQDGPTLRLTLTGELDIASGAHLGARLSELRSAGTAAVLDLSRLSFIDCGGLRVILEASEAAGRDGSTLEIAPEHPQPLIRLLELSGSPALAGRLGAVACTRSLSPESEGR